MTTADIQRTNFLKRLVIPVGSVLAIVLVTSLIYEISWEYKDSQLLYSMFSVLTVLMFISIFFPAFFIYPYTYFKGATPLERVIASLIPLFIWMGKEILRISSVFSVGESLYFGLNPIFILLLLFTLFQMALCQPFCRWRHKKRSAIKMRIFSKLTVALLLGSLAALLLDLALGLKIGMAYFDLYKGMFF
jgi:hypothetical protein